MILLWLDKRTPNIVTADQTKLVQEIARQAPDVLVGFQPDVANS